MIVLCIAVSLCPLSYPTNRVYIRDVPTVALPTPNIPVAVSDSPSAAMSVTQTVSVAQTWQDLRKNARLLESEVDRRLMSLNKLGNTLGADRSLTYNNTAANRPLEDVRCEVDELTTQLQNTISQLSNVNEQMNALVAQSSSLNSNAAPQHMLRRHRDILRDYHYEFNRARDNIARTVNRQQLMGAGEDTQAYDLDNGLNARSRDPLLKENEHIQSSERLLDEQISIAMNTRQHLGQQRSALNNITKRINTITKRYPALNSLMHKVQLKKRKDVVVLSVVVATCLFLMIVYMMHSG